MGKWKAFCLDYKEWVIQISPLPFLQLDSNSRCFFVGFGLWGCRNSFPLWHCLIHLKFDYYIFKCEVSWSNLFEFLYILLYGLNYASRPTEGSRVKPTLAPLPLITETHRVGWWDRRNLYLCFRECVTICVVCSERAPH